MKNPKLNSLMGKSTKSKAYSAKGKTPQQRAAASRAKNANKDAKLDRKLKTRQQKYDYKSQRSASERRTDAIQKIALGSQTTAEAIATTVETNRTIREQAKYAADVEMAKATIVASGGITSPTTATSGTAETMNPTTTSDDRGYSPSITR